MSTKNPEGTPKKGRSTIAAEASRRREQLQKMKDAELRRQQLFREERERLALALAAIEVEERKSQRKQELQQRQRVCYALGELVLDAILLTSMSEFTIATSSLSSLKLSDFDLLKSVVSRGKTVAPGRDARPDILQAGSTAPPDLLL